MIGQERLLEKEFPQFVLLLGKTGSGKKRLIKEKYKDTVGVFTKVDDVRWVIDDSKDLTKDRTYIFDGNKMTYPAQHALLKIAEEPNEYTRIVITGRFENNYLSTILTRATTYHMDKYTKEQLKEFTDDEDMLKYYETPGLLKKAKKEDIEIAQDIAEKIKDIRIANIFLLKNNIEDFKLVSKPIKYEFRDKPNVLKKITEYENYYDRYGEDVLDEMFLMIREELDNEEEFMWR